MRSGLRTLAAVAFAAASWLGAPAVAQSIGDPIAAFRAELGEDAPDDDGWHGLDGELRVRPRERAGRLWRLDVAGALGDAELERAADLLAVASGYGEALQAPIAEFLSGRASEFAGRGPVEIAVQEYRLQLDVTAGDPPRAEMTLYLPKLEPEAFPEPAATRGPADARHVIRTFSDFQCPFCQRFALGVQPRLEEELLGRGDVRLEYHHFPLENLHPNAAPAAEAAECVAEAGGEEAFWSFHDLLFERREAWAELGDPFPYFTRLAREVGLAREPVAACLEEGRHAPTVRAAARAATELGLTGTPTVFVNGFRLSDYRDLSTYERYLELSEAFRAPEAGAD